MGSKMKWSNLKKNACPKCDKDWAYDIVEAIISGVSYLKHGCGFMIRQARYSQIVNSQVTTDLERKLQQEQDEML
jgi:hypothetical protein